MDKQLEDLGYSALAWLIVAVGSGAIAAGLWLWAGRVRLLPEQHYRPVPWTGLDVWMVFAVFLLLPSIVYQVLAQAGAYRAIYGDGAGSPELLERQALWAVAIAFPLQFALIVFAFRHLHGTRAAHLGLSRTRLLDNVIGGYLLWLVLTPLALGVYFVVTLLELPDLHPLERMLKQHQLMPAEVILLVFGAVVVAAVMEELVFRGVLLGWQLSRGLDVQLLVGVAALLAAVGLGWRKDHGLPVAAVLFVSALLPGYFLLPFLCPRLPEEPDAHDDLAGEYPAPHWKRGPLADVAAHYGWRASSPQAQALLAVYGNALLFAAFHAAVWPSPIPLFVLALGLAWLRYRTQSLVGPIVVHALFNAVACLVMFLPKWG